MGIQSRGMHAQPVQVVIGQLMADHFHPCIPVMPGQLPSTYENEEAAIFFSNLLSYGSTEVFHVLGIDASVGNDERTSQLDNMSITIRVSHMRKLPFSKSMHLRILYCQGINLKAAMSLAIAIKGFKRLLPGHFFTSSLSRPALLLS